MLHLIPELLILGATAVLSAGIACAVSQRRAAGQMRQVRSALESRVQELETLMKVLPVGIGIATDRSCRDIRTNPAFADILGISTDRNSSLSATPTSAPTEFKVFVGDRELKPNELPIQRAAFEATPIQDFEEVVVRSDGRRTDLLCHAAPIFGQDRVCRGAVGVFVDITERKAAEARLRASLLEKQVLVQEIHHRVKNNLQFIISLLRLQGAEMRSPELRVLLEETRSRVHAIALVHEKLYRAEDLARLDYGSYLRELVATLSRTVGERNPQVAISVEASPDSLGTSAAVPIGLIVSELVSNSLKHAFPGGRQGRIAVTLGGAPDRGYDLVVRDDGIGAAVAFDPAASGTMGWRLVGMLTRQLDGTITMQRDGGTGFAIHFSPRQNP